MKKLLSIVTAIGLTATTGTTVIACGNNQNESKDPINEDDQKIVDAIKSTTFTKSVTLKSQAKEVSNDVNAKFIKDRLTEEFSQLFNNDLFTLKTIMNNQGTKLSDNDLATVQTIKATINYDYGSVKNESTELLITIKEINITPRRSKYLKIIKDELKSRGYTSWWQSYFFALEDDISQFTFQFSETSLEENRIIQNIIDDEIKLIMKADFKNWNITDDFYEPDSVKVLFNNFQINEKDKTIFAKGKVEIEVKYLSPEKWTHLGIPFDDYLINYWIV